MKIIVAALALIAASLGHVALADDAKGGAPTRSGNFYTGDAKVVVVKAYAGPDILPKPADVVINDFKVPLDGISIDDSLAARLHRHHQLHKGEDVDSTPEILAQHVQAAFSGALVAELKKANIPAAKGAGGAGTGAPSDLVVNGEFITMNEGNESQRVMIGFGLGASDIQAHVTVSSIRETGPLVVREFNMSAESNKKPGAAITSSSSLAVGTAKKAAGDRHSKVEADAARMGTLVAQQIEGLMAEQKWIDGAGSISQAAASAPGDAAKR